jgi:hypothetical protein
VAKEAKKHDEEKQEWLDKIEQKLMRHKYEAEAQKKAFVECIYLSYLPLPSPSYLLRKSINTA